MKRVTHSNPILGTDACYAIAAIGCLSRAFTCVFEQDAAALQVLLEYLSAAEGELWRTVRGKGLAYSYSLYGDIEAGLVYYALSKSSNLPAAFEVGVASLISLFAGSPACFICNYSGLFLLRRGLVVPILSRALPVLYPISFVPSTALFGVYTIGCRQRMW